jgi:hypothetical protein
MNSGVYRGRETTTHRILHSSTASSRQASTPAESEQTHSSSVQSQPFYGFKIFKFAAVSVAPHCLLKTYPGLDTTAQT